MENSNTVSADLQDAFNNFGLDADSCEVLPVDDSETAQVLVREWRHVMELVKAVGSKVAWFDRSEFGYTAGKRQVQYWVLHFERV